ncbi:LOW QUALITY PROTEIN: hypothetical protein TorRG33x02_225710 [Trema orientale]|uniref:DUF1985 domain-containing protein n=1 Tax=Trema orientale TaxID=63057 RepID=A0A2P5E7U7_TREOI|nr:LOW QUALITY PROTEIN: hypothetical protein TorRG33x02_225710 [Trema orientale]
MGHIVNFLSFNSSLLWVLDVVLFLCDVTNFKNKLKETYFLKKTNVSRRDLKDFLITHQKIGNDEDAVKLAKVFMVENILMSKREIILIDYFIFKLVDDENKFEDYPWGRLCYEKTIKYFRQALRNKNIIDGKRSYEVCGFPWVLQVWAFEIIPRLGSKFASYFQETNPSILNWREAKNKHCKGVLKLLDSEKVIFFSSTSTLFWYFNYQ